MYELVCSNTVTLIKFCTFVGSKCNTLNLMHGMEKVKFFPSRHQVNFAQRRYKTGRHKQSVSKIQVVWDVMLCHWVSTLRSFEISYCLDL